MLRITIVLGIWKFGKNSQIIPFFLFLNAYLSPCYSVMVLARFMVLEMKMMTRFGNVKLPHSSNMFGLFCKEITFETNLSNMSRVL